MTLIYDTAKPSDINAIDKIEHLDFSPYEALSRQSLFEHIQATPESFLVARNEQGQVIGYIMGQTSSSRHLTDDLFEQARPNQPEHDWLIIIGLAIHPDYQGKGIAQQLMKNLIKLAKRSNRKGLSLTCHDFLIPYYERFGYVNEGIGQSIFGGTEWYDMTLEI
ncbi:MAG: GNAT family N-acetyltransferase [Streptococcaceae bacterium]|nr:GNAT family N-acetyltransferase [Streptococcaceae bacterium]MCL2858665.1 GNAT family N-acetyltransferase [Streptococcaceae bacterium]